MEDNDLDIIMPSDNEAAEPQAEEPTETTEVTEVEDTKPTEETQEQTEVTEQPKLKIKYNHEEKELTLEEATELAQKGMNYDKTVERLKALENDPRLSFIESQAQRYNMTPEQYIEAVKQQEEQAQLDQLIQANIPEEYAKEMIENRRFRQQYQAKENERVEQEKQNAEARDFFAAFPDVKIETIPEEVWQLNNQGVPLKYAYMEHRFNESQNKIKVLEQNLANKSKAAVNSVTTHGNTEVAAEDDFMKGFNSL